MIFYLDKMQPKGDIVIDCGQALLKNGYSIRIFNTINFRKSMHYNPFAYIHSEKDILKLTTTLIANTKGDGKAGDEFWTSATRSSAVRSWRTRNYVAWITDSFTGEMMG